MRNNFQLRAFPREIQGVVTQMGFYTFVQDGNVPYLIENGDKVVQNWNHLDNNWNANNPALRRNSFLSLPLFGRVLFC